MHVNSIYKSSRGKQRVKGDERAYQWMQKGGKGKGCCGQRYLDIQRLSRQSRRGRGHRRAREEGALTLHVDTPFILIKSICLQSPLLAQSLGFINVLVSTIVSCTRITFRVFVYTSDDQRRLTLLSCRLSSSYFASHFLGHQGLIGK